LLHPAVEVTLKVFEILLGIFFVPASAGYWIFERGRAVDFVASLLPGRSGRSSATPGI